MVCLFLLLVETYKREEKEGKDKEEKDSYTGYSPADRCRRIPVVSCWTLNMLLRSYKAETRTRQTCSDSLDLDMHTQSHWLETHPRIITLHHKAPEHFCTCITWLAHTLVVIRQLNAVQTVGRVARVGVALVYVSFAAFTCEARRAVTAIATHPVHTGSVVLTLGHPTRPAGSGTVILVYLTQDP